MSETRAGWRHLADLPLEAGESAIGLTAWTMLGVNGFVLATDRGHFYVLRFRQNAVEFAGPLEFEGVAV